MQHRRRRLTTAAIALALTSGAAVATGAVTAATASAADSTGVSIPSPDASVDRGVKILASGLNGVLYQEEGTAGYLWTNTSNSGTKTVTALAGVEPEAIVSGYDAYNRVGYWSTAEDGSAVITWLWMENSNPAQTLTVPSGYENPQASGGFVVASHALEDGSRELRVLRGGGATPYDVQVQLPAGAEAGAEPEVLAGEGTDLILGYRQDGKPAYAIVSGITGAVRVLPVTGTASNFRMTTGRVSWFSREGADGTTGFRVLSRTGTSTTPAITPVTPQSEDSEIHSYLVGANVLWYEGSHGPLQGSSVLADVDQAFQHGSGAMLAVGRATADGTRAIHYLSVDGNGEISDYSLHTLAPVLYYGSVQALSLDRGTVRFVNSLRGSLSLEGKDIGPGLDPVAGADAASVATTSGAGRFADGTDEGLALLTADPDTGLDVLTTADDSAGIALPNSGGRIVDASPQYVLYETGDSTRQYVVDIGRNAIVRAQAAEASALDYATLWTPSPTTPGTVVAISMRTGKTLKTLDLGYDCTPDDLRATTALLYWSCGAAAEAGVRNIAYGQNYYAPVGADLLLGDNFYAYYDAAAGVIRRYEAMNDGNSSLDPITGVKATAATDTRGVTWAVDPHSNKVAYVDSNEVVHVVKAYSSLYLVSALSVPDSTVPATFASAGGAARWKAQWWLSKPAASWTVTLRNTATGATVRTWTGGESRSTVRLAWDGKDDALTLLPNGSYTWTLTAAPADGQGAALTRSGTVALTGATAVRRDHAGSDGFGDLLTLSSSGALAFQKGTGTAAGKFSGTLSASGWPTSVKAVSFGDLSGDRCNDVLVRLANGSMRAYRPGCGKALTTSTAYTSLGTGWNQYDVLTSPGDLTGDRRADLIVRNSSTGAVYLYKATSAGKLSARVKLYANWKTYKKIVGAGDLNGDGFGDLLAQDKSNVLWRYNGTGTGGLKARVKVASGWGASYNVVVGVGDITGDGKADLVARDTSGNLWRQSGNGKGGFAARVKIATGWKAYKGIF
ncbi:FG-GAP-like repeat-containing protein [Streptomyces sp. NBC_01537]|uniref:FG-GAP-like repeat-containing protein n=1 Tax=Streptomyces sp. NBC_01537 TaxID=2903896 RepID=UPI00386E1AB4